MNCDLLAEEEDEMGFSPQNEAWVRDEIKSSIDKALRGIKPPSGIRKALYLMREWGILAADITVIVTLAVVAATQWSAANNRLAAESTFQKGTDDRLKAIEKALNDLQHPSPLQTFLDMDQSQFSRQLAKLADVASEAQKKGVADSIEHITEIQRKLAPLVPSDTPEATRAASSIINYASFVREKNNDFPNAKNVVKTPCAEAFHIDHPSEVPNTTLDVFNIATCKQRIDNGIIWKNGTFTNTIIVWEGNPIRLENVRFVNCIFVFSNPAKWPEPAMQFAEQILIKDIGLKPAFTVSTG